MAMQTGTNPIEMLKADHQKVKGLFTQFESADEEQKPEIFKQIMKELQVHTKIEEEIFYPAVKKLESEMAVEAEEEHNIVDWIMGQMKKLKPDDEHYEAKFTTLKENVQHHIEEEEKEMFPKAQEKLGNQMMALGQQMMERKETLMKRGSSSRSRSTSRSGSRSRSGGTSRSRKSSSSSRSR